MSGVEAIALALGGTAAGLAVVVAVLAIRGYALASTVAALSSSLADERGLRAQAEAARDAAGAKAATLDQTITAERAARAAADGAALAAQEEAQRAKQDELGHLAGDDLSRAVDDELRRPLPGAAAAAPGPGAGAAPAGDPVR